MICQYHEGEEQCPPFAAESERGNEPTQPTQAFEQAIATAPEQKPDGICERCGRPRRTLYRHGTGEFASYWCGTCLAREARRINTREMYGRGRRGY
jgi:hypothetical protein